MWIVALALRRPYTFVVMALVIILLMPLAIVRTPVDIFPEINIPVISVIWNYTGFAPQDMANRIVGNSERITTAPSATSSTSSRSRSRDRRHQGISSSRTSTSRPRWRS